MALFVTGLVVLFAFYALIFGVGIWAAWRNRARKYEKDQYDHMMTVGRRDIGLVLGVFTLTATWVGGGYVNGLAEVLYTPGQGLLWGHPLVCSAMVFLLSGLFFAKKMRDYGFVTMLDPFQQKFGNQMGGFLSIPAVAAEVFWSAAVLIALGGTLSVIIGINRVLSIILSSCIAIIYTLLGGIYSVTYTDVAQLTLIFIGLWLCVGFAFVNPAVSDITTTAYEGPRWLGTLSSEEIGSWLDQALLVIFGGIPWQVYFQRVLAAESGRKAQIMSFIAALGAFTMGIPSVLMGAIAASTDWNQTAYEGDPRNNSEALFILPIAIRYLTPDAVSVFGLAAISAAVMSSIDSSLLSAASMFAKNIYATSLRKKANKVEINWIIRLSIVIFGGLSMLLALTSTSSFGLWYLSLDVVFVILFPHLTCVLYLDPNVYGSAAACIIGFILRFGAGEVSLNVKPFIHFPGGVNFPIKTFIMVVTLTTLMVVSWITRYLFARGFIPERYDFLKSNLANDGRSLKARKEVISTNSKIKHVDLNELLDKNVKS